MNTEENKPESAPELTPEMQKIVDAAVAQALAQQNSGNSQTTLADAPTKAAPEENNAEAAPTTEAVAPKGTPGKWGMWLALRTCLTRYADFDGRASRSEYWYATLANFIIIISLEILVGLGVWLAICTGVPGIIVASILGLLLLSYNILMIVPGLSLAVRRMHDTNRSGWAICFYLIPLAGPIIFLIFLLSASGESNQYGKAPAHPVSDDEKAPAIVAWLIKTCHLLFVEKLGKTLALGGGGIVTVAVIWTGLHLLLAPANPLKPLYKDGVLKEKALGFGTIGKLNAAYQNYLDGKMEITGYPFVLELLKAAREEDFTVSVDVLKALVEAGADVNATGGSDFENVWNAAYELGDPAILKYLVSVGVQKQDTHPSFGRGGCYMYDAVANDKPAMLRALAEVGCNVDYRRDEIDVTALMIAINQNKTEMVKLLAELKADFNAYYLDDNEQKVTVFDVTANKNPEMLPLVEELGAIPCGEIATNRLFEIADSGNLEAFNAMKSKGVDLITLSKMTNKHGSTPLMIAANFAPVDLVKAMLNAGFDVNAQGTNGDTALIYGVKKPEMVKTLLDAGADASVTDKEGKTALTRAIGSDAEESIRLLLQAGMDVKGETVDKHSYLTYAATNGKCKSIRVLVELGADVNAPDAAGHTPLYRAVMADNAEAIRTLIELGADVNWRNAEGKAFIHIAAVNNKPMALKQLLSIDGMDVNMPVSSDEMSGVTALHLAASANSTAAIKVLLDTSGININAGIENEESKNMTALHLAASKKDNAEALKLLLSDSRINVNAKVYIKSNQTYSSAIVFAAEDRNDEGVKLLLDTGAVSAEDAQQALKAANIHGTRKSIEMLLLYTPNPEKVKAANAAASTTETSGTNDIANSQNRTEETANAGSSDIARDELPPIIARIQSMKATSSNKLYRTRLLQLLPMILEGEDVNLTLPETKGNTALHYACGLGDVELVTWLLENGANPNKLTDKGMSPYKCAGGKQVKTIQNLLREYGGNP